MPPTAAAAATGARQRRSPSACRRRLLISTAAKAGLLRGGRLAHSRHLSSKSFSGSGCSKRVMRPLRGRVPGREARRGAFPGLFVWCERTEAAVIPRLPAISESVYPSTMVRCITARCLGASSAERLFHLELFFRSRNDPHGGRRNRQQPREPAASSEAPARDDADEPALKRGRFAESAQLRPGTHKRILDAVLGIPIAHHGTGEPDQPAPVALHKVRERLDVALLRALDQSPLGFVHVNRSLPGAANVYHENRRRPTR